MKVLIIDDEEDTRSIASMSLSILGGLDVLEAESGHQGISNSSGFAKQSGHEKHSRHFPDRQSNDKRN
jgi:CheY-like chemotaxis protein